MIPIMMDRDSETGLNRICLHLPSQDLKRVRLICKALDLPAQRALFRLVWLRGNIDSFHNLDLISRHPVIRHHVKIIHHSGEMVNEYPDFDHWNKRLGGELDVTWKSRDVLRAQYTKEDLEYHYLKYLRHMEGQKFMNSDNTAELRLVKALEKLPRVDSIEFAWREIEPDGNLEGTIPFSTIGRETLSEPCGFGGFAHQPKQFIALLEAASQSCKNLTTIRGVRLRWKTFKSPDQMKKILGAVKNIQHLSLTMEEELDRKDRRQQLAQIIASALDLKTLELCFGRLSFEEFKYIIDLKQLLKNRSSWPNLQRLALQGFSTSEKALKIFLKRHAGTLKSLALSDMKFPLLAPLDSMKSPKSGGSIWSLVLFLSSLKLEHVEFNGTLSNDYDEGWVVNQEQKYTSARRFLLFKIRNFVVHGGECPLEGLDPEDEDDEWRLRGDESWRFEFGLLQ